MLTDGDSQLIYIFDIHLSELQLVLRDLEFEPVKLLKGLFILHFMFLDHGMSFLCENFPSDINAIVAHKDHVG